MKSKNEYSKSKKFTLYIQLKNESSVKLPKNSGKFG